MNMEVPELKLLKFQSSNSKVLLSELQVQSLNSTVRNLEFKNSSSAVPVPKSQFKSSRPRGAGPEVDLQRPRS